VVANKKVPRKVEVILQEDVKQVGVRGAIANVAAGFYRNYLLPNGLAQPVTETVLSQIKAEEAKVDAKKKSLKGRAETIARALEVAKNFIIKKEAKDETIYGSVGMSEVRDAIKKQTGLDVDESCIDLPSIKALGTFEVVAKMHPEVQATFNVVVQKA